MTSMRLIGNTNGFRRAIHVIASGTAMLMDIDEAWADVSVAGVYDRGINWPLHFMLGPNREDSIALYNHRTFRQNRRWQNNISSKHNTWHRHININDDCRYWCRIYPEAITDLQGARLSQGAL